LGRPPAFSPRSAPPRRLVLITGGTPADGRPPNYIGCRLWQIAIKTITIHASEKALVELIRLVETTDCDQQT
jgi:hypothetical protein